LVNTDATSNREVWVSPKLFQGSTDTLEISQVGNPNSTITRLQFSPRENLIAWTDSDGALSRWLKPVSDNFPDPVKVSSVTNGAPTVPMKRNDIDLFGNDITGGGASEKNGNGDVDLDEDLIDIDDGWIVDDMDGAHKAELPKGKRDSFVKEMGESSFHRPI